jgi:Mechanosensitive ion channel, conserved TM helix
MIHTLEEVFRRALGRLSDQITTYLPPLLVALAMVVVAFLVATGVRWLLVRAVKGARFDRFLKESGLSSMLGGAGRVRGVPLVAGAAYWLILIAGLLAAVDVFDTKLSSQIVETSVFLLPKLVVAGAILLVGAWLAQYVGRSVLVWASNEELPAPRRWAALVRAVLVFITIVVAADVLSFAANIFFAAFVIVAGGVALAIGLALGLGARETVERYLRGKAERPQESEERSLWSHL